MKVYDNSGNYKIIPRLYEEDFDITVADMSRKRLTKQERTNLEQCLRYGVGFIGKSMNIDEVIRKEASVLMDNHMPWTKTGKLIRSVKFTGIERRARRVGMDYYVLVSMYGMEFRIDGAPVLPPDYELVVKNVI